MKCWSCLRSSLDLKCSVWRIVASKCCYIATLDGWLTLVFRYWEMQYVGEFIMYKNEEKMQEVTQMACCELYELDRDKC